MTKDPERISLLGTVSDKPEDDDVLIEKQQVRDLKDANLRVIDVYKNFEYVEGSVMNCTRHKVEKPVVKGVSFGVKIGECFGNFFFQKKNKIKKN